jgi:hypothetical protein
MKVTMLLADAAQAVDGKLYILGGGWSITGPIPSPSAIALKIDVPWDQANKKHRWDLSLLDGDGHSVLVGTPQGEQPVQISGEFEVGRPPGLVPGVALDATIAFNVGPLPLEPGSRFVWRLSIDDASEESWQLAFTTRPAQTPAPGEPPSA